MTRISSSIIVVAVLLAGCGKDSKEADKKVLSRAASDGAMR